MIHLGHGILVSRNFLLAVFIALVALDAATINHKPGSIATIALGVLVLRGTKQPHHE